MNPESQRIAIAEACGWKLEFLPKSDTDETSAWDVIKPNGSSESLTIYAKKSDAIKRLPDYLNDLNACHEMEKLLFDTHGKRKHDLFRDHLENTTSRDWSDEKHWSPFTVTATAPQRCEAFLKTLGLWKDES